MIAYFFVPDEKKFTNHVVNSSAFYSVYFSILCSQDIFVFSNKCFVVFKISLENLQSSKRVKKNFITESTEVGETK